jgi:hypothetical protein
LEDDPARDAATRLLGERLAGVRQRIDAADLRLDPGCVDQLRDLDELGTVRVAHEEDDADGVAIGGRG